MKMVVSKTKHSKTKTEARSTRISKTKHPGSKTKHPKTRNRSVLFKHETNANTAGIKHYNESNSPFPHHRAWSQAITLEQILTGSDLTTECHRYPICKTIGFFFLKISKEVGKAWRKSNTSEPHTPFSASFQTFCVTAHAHWKTPKSADGQF